MAGLLHSLWEALVSHLWGMVQGFWLALKLMFTGVVQWMWFWASHWCQYTLEGLWLIVRAQWAALQNIAWLVIDTFVLIVVPQYQPAFETFRDYWEAANYWVPLSESVAMVVGYFAFLAAFCTFKYSWRLVPFFH